jgi:hypothetical protein
MSDLPKVLFLADEIPQSKNAGSIQFYRLFESYPADRLLVVGRTPSTGASILSCKYIELTYKFFDRWRLTRFSRWLADGEALGLIRYKMPTSVRSQIDAFNPDVVVTLMQLYMYYQSAYTYAKEKGKPLILFCHDDVEEFSNVHSFFRDMLIKRNAIIYQYAKRRLCISPQMVEAWEKKYGAKGEVMYPVPDHSITPRPIKYASNLRSPGRLTLGFAGSMAYGYAEGIRELIPALEETNTYLKIYNSPSKALPANASPNLEFCGYAATANETWHRVKEECDAVILPYSCEARFRKLYETHFPSKLPEYLLLGIPTIIIGPSYATGVVWGISNKERVYVISEGDGKVLSDELINLKNDASLRISLSHLAEKAMNRSSQLTFDVLHLDQTN